MCFMQYLNILDNITERKFKVNVFLAELEHCIYFFFKIWIDFLSLFFEKGGVDFLLIRSVKMPIIYSNIREKTAIPHFIILLACFH